MQSPGSNPDIPEQGEVEFKEQWNRAKPGTKHKIGFLQLKDGGRLAVFPHREWDPPLEDLRLCVLFPVRNAAVAAPIGGIPDEERVGDEPFPVHRQGRTAFADGDLEQDLDLSEMPADARRMLAARIGSIVGEVYEALNRIDRYMQELDPEYAVE